MSNNGTSIKSLQREIENIRIEIEGLKLHSGMEQVEAKELSPEEDKALLLGLIKKGYHSPSELKQLTPFGVNKMYKLLEELEKDGLVRKVGSKRRRRYVSVDEVV